MTITLYVLSFLNRGRIVLTFIIPFKKFGIEFLCCCLLLICSFIFFKFVVSVVYSDVLFLTFFVPCILWVFMWFYKVISNRDFHEDIGMDNPLNDKNIDESDLENH